MDVAYIRGMAIHERWSLPFASFVIGKNIKFSIPSVLKAMGEEDCMTPTTLSIMLSSVLSKGAHCAPADIAMIVGSDPNTIRRSLRKDPELFGCKAIVSGKRIKVPTIPLIRSLTGASTENIKAAIAAYFCCFCFSASIFFFSSSICRS